MTSPTAAAVIRDANDADADGIFHIYNHAVRTSIATFDTVEKTPEQRSDWMRAHTPDRYAVLIAEIDGVIVGWAALNQWSPRCAYDRAAEVSVYIRDGHHRRGLGRALLAALIERARDNGFGVLLSRIADRDGGSVPLHRALGFQTIGIMRRVGEKFGRVLDVELMDLHLDGH